MSSIKSMLPEECLAIRNGAQVSLSAADLVPGDIVCIKAGNKLPADMRFLQTASDTKFDRSILTGESMPLAGSVDSTDANYLETRCIGLQGTHCVSGSCVGLVVAIGDKTVFGRIAALTNEPKAKRTTLEKEVMRFVLIIVSIMLTMIVVVLIVWWVMSPHPPPIPPLNCGPIMLTSHSSQGRVSQKVPPGLDQCAEPHRQLCQCCHCVYS